MADNTSNTDEPKASAPRWPYTSFKSILNTLARFEGDGALPSRIDRSVLGGSEGQKTQVMAAMKFLGMIGDNGEVRPLMREMVKDEKERRRIVRELLPTLYPEATRLGQGGTTKQLEETFAGLNGDTLRKAMTFYLHACKFSGYAVSKHFKIPSGYKATRKPKTPGNGGTPAMPIVQQQQHGGTNTPADAKARYIEMLLDKASKTEELDTTLLDRIEKLLGYPTE